MRVTVPDHFRHAAEITDVNAAKDPRGHSFGETVVDVDLRGCIFVRPAAALWCVVYPLLARLRGSRVRFLVPEQRGVCVYLKSLGLFGTLQGNGVEVDDRGIREQRDPQIIMPLTAFRSSNEVDTLANAALESLKSAGLGAFNLYPLVSEIFSELALNAVEHSQSPIGAYGFIQLFRDWLAPDQRRA